MCLIANSQQLSGGGGGLTVVAPQEDHGLGGAGLLPARQGLLQHLPQYQDRPGGEQSGR